MKSKTARILSILISVLVLFASCGQLMSDGESTVSVNLPYVNNGNSRAVSSDDIQRIKGDHASYRVHINDRVLEGTGGNFSATFPVGSRVYVFIECVNAKGEVILRTVTKSVVVASGGNNIDFNLKADGNEITSPAPSAPTSPTIEYVNITFNQGFVYTNTLHQQTPSTWITMTGAILPKDGQREKGSAVSLDQASATGYVFKGWVESNTQPTGGAPNTQSFDYVQNYNSNTTLYAIWEELEPGSHEVKFETGAGSDSVNGMPTNTQKQSTTLVSWTERPTRVGYEFTGWSASVSGVNVTQPGNSWEFTMPDSGVTLTAQWQLKTYNVTYNTGDPNLSIPQHTRTYGQSFSLNPTSVSMTRTGYSFANWTWQKAGSSAPITITGGSSTSEMQNYDGDIEFTAVWTPNTYNITYYDVDASSASAKFSGTHGSDHPTRHTYGTATPLVNPTTTKKGGTFGGWYTDNSGTTSAGNSLGATAYTTAIKLYAKWTLDIDMVTVTGGTSFTMGEAGGSDNVEWSGVTVSTFKMGKYEITQAQWEAVMGNKGNSSTIPSASYGVGDNFPQYFVSWYDALIFCNKLSILENKTPCYSISGSTDPASWGTIPTSTDSMWDAVVCDWSANGYRLPTEAEWEYAARGGSNKSPFLYSGSGTVDDVAWYKDNSDGKTHEVGTTTVKENALGISDMSGNAFEWCWDWYYANGYAIANTSGGSINTQDPTGATSGSSRVLRGGSRFFDASFSSVSYRYYKTPYSRYYNDGGYGFRVVCRD